MPDYTPIPDPTPDVNSLYQAVIAMKATIEVLTRQRKPLNSGAVTFQDLMNFGILGKDGKPLQNNGVLMNQLATLFSGASPTDLTDILTSALLIANNLSDLDDASAARTALGLGGAALLDAGTSVGDLVQVLTGGKLPVLDGSNLTGISSTGRLVAGTAETIDPASANFSITWAHGLGQDPDVFTSYLECKTAEHGYSVGDRVFTPFFSSSTSYGANATTAFCAVTNNGLQLVDRSTKAVVTLTAANWKHTITPYKLS